MYKHFTPTKLEQIPEDYQPMVTKFNCPGSLITATFFNDFSEAFSFWSKLKYQTFNRPVL